MCEMSGPPRLTQKPLTIDPKAWRIKAWRIKARQMTLRRNLVPLIVCVAIIVLRYAFGYLYGRYPELLADRNLPLSTRRSFTRGTPRGLFGRIGLMAAHSNSLNS
jgi:hypothetical protein